MPYIKQENRKKYDDDFFNFSNAKIETKGDLEYCIFKLMKFFMSTRENKYSNLHDCVYAAQHCADEFRRRYLDKREDKAIEENGDIL